MIPLLLLIVLFNWPAARGEIVDRTAIVVGKHLVKASDIRRDIAVTSFLNGTEGDLGVASRKQSAARLIDQELIRKQMRAGRYAAAPEFEGTEVLERTKKERYASDAEYRRALTRLGLSETDVRDALQWQLTVLRFIEARFRPLVNVSDSEIQKYYDANKLALSKTYPAAKGVADLKSEIEDLIAGEQVNKLLDEWLDRNRAETRIEYLEKSLQ